MSISVPGRVVSRSWARGLTQDFRSVRGVAMPALTTSFHPKSVPPNNVLEEFDKSKSTVT